MSAPKQGAMAVESSRGALGRPDTGGGAKGDLLGILGHELRTPINAIVGFAQLLLSHEPQSGPAPREWARQILEAGWHLLAITQQTLDLARVEVSGLEVPVAAIELAPVFASCRQMLSRQAEEHGVVIKEAISSGSASCAVWADPTRLKQVLTNLVSNAIKYNRAGGEVVLGVRHSDESVDITVADTGVGMTAAQLRMLYVPFNRLGREGGEVEGSGIGLTISKKLTESMGGTLDVQSVAGVGTTFTVRLRHAAKRQPDVAPGEGALNGASRRGSEGSSTS